MDLDRCPCGAYPVARGRCYQHLHHDPVTSSPQPDRPADDYQPTWLPQEPITIYELRDGLIRLGIQPRAAARAAAKVAP